MKNEKLERALNQNFPSMVRERLALLTPWLWNPSLQNCKDANFLVLQPQACIWLSLQLWQTKARRQLMIMRMEITMGFKVLTGVGSREKKGRGAGMDRGYMVKSFRKFLYVKKERNMPNTEKQMAWNKSLLMETLVLLKFFSWELLMRRRTWCCWRVGQYWQSNVFD